MELRELIASTIWEIATVKLEYGEDPFVENTDTVADAILAALDAAGLVGMGTERELRLMAERDEARAAVKRLAGALEELSGITVYNTIDRSPLTQTQIRNMVEEAARFASDVLADPVLRHLGLCWNPAHSVRARPLLQACTAAKEIARQ